MKPRVRHARALLAGLAVSASGSLVTAQQTFTPKQIVQWAQGGDRERGMLTQMGLPQLAQGQFGLSAADLNGDGRPEILVLSMAACDATGCPVTAIQNAGAGKVNQIFSQRVTGRLAITNEQVDGYYALAAADQAGAIMRDASGPLVFRVGGAQPGARLAAAAPPPAAAPARAAPAPTAAASAAAAPAAPISASVGPATPTERQKITLGWGQPDWRTPGAEYIPACMFPICLNMQPVEKTGIGTADARIRGEVTADDAARWCAIYKPLDKLCAQTEIANYGTAGGAMGRPKTTVITANCVAGTMQAIDEMPYQYAGTWPDGAGAGKPKFDGAGVGTRIYEQQSAAQVQNGSESIYQLARDASSGEALAVHWELLCKGAPAPSR
jgi:hypothetical protein